MGYALGSCGMAGFIAVTTSLNVTGQSRLAIRQLTAVGKALEVG